VAIDPVLAASYETCRRLNAKHGQTYYLATLLLPAHKRPAVHALYGFARYADEIVDDLESDATPQQRADELGEWGRQFLTDLRRGVSADPVGRAVVDTIRRWNIPVSLFEDFLASMESDLTVTRYPRYADLEQYMWGSASVIGLQMLPVLEPQVPTDEAAPYAIALGQAFQLSNFLRDVAEDFQRARIYLPLEDMAAHGVSVEELAAGAVTREFSDLMAFEIERTRALYRTAAPGIDLLHPTSRDCVRTAFRLYGGILTEIERAQYDVFSRRVRVGRIRRLSVAGPGLVRAGLARRGGAQRDKAQRGGDPRGGDQQNAA
jgi:phytoene synthase